MAFASPSGWSAARQSLTILAMLAGGLAGMAADGGQAVIPPEPVTRVAPEKPKSADDGGSGQAVIECTIGEDGSIRDAVVRSATKLEYGEAALAALQKWTFKPGQRDGQPATMRIQVPFSFENPLEARIEAYAKRKVFVQLADPVISAEELGTWPNVKQLLEARYPEELKGSGKRGKAVVAVVVDKQGKVINPRVVKATYPEFSLPALVTAVSMEFDPQKGKDGKPIYVSMQLQFDFRDSAGKKGKAEAKAKAKKPAVVPPVQDDP